MIQGRTRLRHLLAANAIDRLLTPEQLREAIKRIPSSARCLHAPRVC